MVSSPAPLPLNMNLVIWLLTMNYYMAWPFSVHSPFLFCLECLERSETILYLPCGVWLTVSLGSVLF